MKKFMITMSIIYCMSAFSFEIEMHTKTVTKTGMFFIETRLENELKKEAKRMCAEENKDSENEVSITEKNYIKKCGHCFEYDDMWTGIGAAGYHRVRECDKSKSDLEKMKINYRNAGKIEYLCEGKLVFTCTKNNHTSEGVDNSSRSLTKEKVETPTGSKNTSSSASQQ